jgi:hypothetical protein
MQTRLIAITLGVLVAGSELAHADHDARASLSEAYTMLKKRREKLADYRAKDLEECNALIEDAKLDTEANGVVSSHSLEGAPKAYKEKGDWKLKIADAPLICTELGKLADASKAAKELGTMRYAIGFMDGLVAGEAGVNDNGVATWKPLVGKCPVDVAVLKAAGITRTVIGTGTLSLAEVEEKICKVFDGAYAGYVKLNDETKAAGKAYLDELTAEYKKVGISGDKLQFLIDMDGKAVYGKGGNELTTAKQKAAAKLMFSVSTAFTEGAFTVTRWVFKGNKKVGVTSQDYARRPGPSAYK